MNYNSDKGVHGQCQCQCNGACQRNSIEQFEKGHRCSRKVFGIDIKQNALQKTTIQKSISPSI